MKNVALFFSLFLIMVGSRVFPMRTVHSSTEFRKCLDDAKQCDKDWGKIWKEKKDLPFAETKVDPVLNQLQKEWGKALLFVIDTSVPEQWADTTEADIVGYNAQLAAYNFYSMIAAIEKPPLPLGVGDKFCDYYEKLIEKSLRPFVKPGDDFNTRSRWVFSLLKPYIAAVAIGVIGYVVYKKYSNKPDASKV